MRKLALAAAIACLTSVAHAGEFTLTDAVVADAVNVTYDPADGNLSMAATGSLQITTIEMKSDGLFLPANVPDGLLAPPFDVASADKLFTLKTDGVSDLNFGNALPTGLSAAEVLSRMSINGSILPQGGFEDAAGGGPYLIVVPEPSSIALLGLGLLGLVSRRRR